MKSPERRTNAIPLIQMSERLMFVAETALVGILGFAVFGSLNYGMALILIPRYTGGKIHLAYSGVIASLATLLTLSPSVCHA